MPRVLIGLGANLGDRAATLNAALRLLADDAEIECTALSSFYESAAVGGEADQPAFLNAAAILQTEYSPQQLLDILQQAEQELGRVRTEHWAARTLDLDILLYDELQMAEPDLQIPHPWLPLRAFALQPAAEIAAEWQHPVLHCAVAELERQFFTPRPYLVLRGGDLLQRAALARELAIDNDAALMLTDTSHRALLAQAGHWASEQKQAQAERGKTPLMLQPIIFVDDYTQPDFKPAKNWVVYRAQNRELILQGPAPAPKSLIPKVRLQFCDSGTHWAAPPFCPTHHWDYLRAIPVPTINVPVDDDARTRQTATIAMEVSRNPATFRTNVVAR